MRVCCSVAFSLRVSLISHRGCSPRPPVHHQLTWRAHAARRARLCLASAGGGGQLPAPTSAHPQIGVRDMVFEELTS